MNESENHTNFMPIFGDLTDKRCLIAEEDHIAEHRLTASQSADMGYATARPKWVEINPFRVEMNM
ncbi:hypothetical protein XBP1_2820002 [Xenorhabdus bovienii str. puntauvense]|uniref:Uncharacterized protein n=2 Tax=Xenorhabdus bovienii TaxID=40576 RepID=A0A077NG64_XENBV|nr:hypothetical protein [Xenorhabdus bovienii]CDG97764.1 hypothetical protein XBP1_2820002 [Xenorhabdus bovienii str. puntauvense]CDH23403.1 hypothetical protein XBKB1_1790005 [Xenorhabdus bovienii str. kraussei Becker Underwood]